MRNIVLLTKEHDQGHTQVKIDYKEIRLSVPKSFTQDQIDDLVEAAHIVDSQTPPENRTLSGVLALEAHYLHLRHNGKVRYIADTGLER